MPEWIPGMGFQKLARKWRPLMTDMNLRPYNFVKFQIDQGVAEDSFLSRLIRAGDSSPAATSINQWSASALFGGAGDTVTYIFSPTKSDTVYADMSLDCGLNSVFLPGDD